VPVIIRQRRALAPAFFALIVGGIGASFSGNAAKESVRDELIRRQSETGLTLAALYSGNLEVVMFSPRSLLETGDGFTGVRSALFSVAGNEVLLSDSRKFSSAQMGGAGLREYIDVAGGYRTCWSYDRSIILTSVEDNFEPIHTTLRILDVPSKTVRDIDSNAYVFLTPQCWSPDGKRFVYETQEQRRVKRDGSSEAVNQTLRIFNLDRNKSEELVKGSEPSWSPDGKQIAFLDHDTYYAISPSGGDKRSLFHKGNADSGLAWSPDSRLVAYTSHNGALERPLLLDVGPVRLRVRRLSDNSEDWVLQLTDAYLPQFQWLENKELVSRATYKKALR